ncbi:MAG: DNA-binding protein [Candidatus Omnitrophica bacterium]|nr:DNA-binding protein [Candidatus Omnitrophota bacterium]
MQVDKARSFIGRFSHQSDLSESLTLLCKKESIRLGVFSVIGAVTSAKLGYYDQESQFYVTCVDLAEKLEITSCAGNISLKENEIFIHAHITLADHSGHCYGGHLMPGSSIFAAEYFIQELEGEELHRVFDRQTGLSLWA